MPGGFDEIGDVVAHRLVSGAAYRECEAARRNLTYLDPGNPRDVARVQRAIKAELRGLLDRIDPAVVADAIVAGMRGECPEW